MSQMIFRKEEMLKVSKIASRWGVSRQHVYNLIDQGQLKPAFRFGGRQGIAVPLSIVVQYERAAVIDADK